MSDLRNLLYELLNKIDGSEVEYLGVKLRINDSHVKRLVLYAIVAQAFSNARIISLPDNLSEVDKIYNEIRRKGCFNKAMKDLQKSLNIL